MDTITAAIGMESMDFNVHLVSFWESVETRTTESVIVSLMLLKSSQKMCKSILQFRCDLSLNYNG